MKSWPWREACRRCRWFNFDRIIRAEAIDLVSSNAGLREELPKNPRGSKVDIDTFPPPAIFGFSQNNNHDSLEVFTLPYKDSCLKL